MDDIATTMSGNRINISVDVIPVQTGLQKIIK